MSAHPFAVQVAHRDAGGMVSLNLLRGTVCAGYLRMREDELGAFLGQLGGPRGFVAPAAPARFELRTEDVERRAAGGPFVVRATLLIYQPGLSGVRAGLVALEIDDFEQFRELVERPREAAFPGDR